MQTDLDSRTSFTYTLPTRDPPGLSLSASLESGTEIAAPTMVQYIAEASGSVYESIS